jgi:hypothetical protein
VVIEYVACDKNEVYTTFSSLRTELLERSEAGFANPIAGALVKPGDS